MANPAFRFAGGPVVDTTTVEGFRQSAAEWIALASLHESAAEVAADAGDFETALEQLRFAETKIATARVRYADARKLQERLRREAEDAEP